MNAEFRFLDFANPQSKPQSENFQLLWFGGKKQSTAPFQSKAVDLNEVQHTLKCIQRREYYDDKSCQADIAPVAFNKNPQTIYIKRKQIVDLQEDEIEENETDTYIQPSFKNEESDSHITEEIDMRFVMPARPISPSELRSQQHSWQNHQEEYGRLKRLEEDPDWEYKQTQEFMLKRMNDQLSQLENLAEGIDRDLRFNKAHFDQFLEENKQIGKKKRQEAGINYLTRLEQRQEDLEPNDRIAKLLADNQALFCEVEARGHETESESSEEMPTQKVSMGPIVLKRQAKRQNIKNIVNQRISSAFNSASQAVKEVRRGGLYIRKRK